MVNTKENQFEASFILPGSSIASHLGLRSVSSLDIKIEEYLSQDVNIEICLPSLDTSFDEAIHALVGNWKMELTT